MTNTLTTTTEFAVVDSKGFDPESVSATYGMADAYGRKSGGAYEIRSRVVSEWEATDAPA